MPEEIKQKGEISLTSPAFSHNETIPTKYTCQGEDINPPLEIKNIPPGVKSLVLIVDDPDAPMGTWDHWIVWNISPQILKIEEGRLPQGALQGKNDFGKLEYGGPCPPPGKPHRYFFKLYALDTLLNLPQGSSKEEVEKAMEGHILGQTFLIGLYQRL